MLVSSGDVQAWNESSSEGTVRSPGTCKNCISVGSSHSYNVAMTRAVELIDAMDSKSAPLGGMRPLCPRVLSPPPQVSSPSIPSLLARLVVCLTRIFLTSASSQVLTHKSCLQVFEQMTARRQEATATGPSGQRFCHMHDCVAVIIPERGQSLSRSVFFLRRAKRGLEGYHWCEQDASTRSPISMFSWHSRP